MNPLQVHLAALRRRLRLVITFRGVCWLLAVVVAPVLLTGLLDWRFQLPGLFRAAVLVGLLAGSGAVALRFLIAPLREKSDDLTLALRVEEHFPSLNDSLASTVQFLEEPADRSSSASLRHEVVTQTLRRAGAFDFKKVIDTRGVKPAGLAAGLACLLALPLVLLQPEFTQIAMARLVDPFGERAWTRMALAPPPPFVASGQPFDIHATLTGVVPREATVTVVVEGAQPAQYVFAIPPEKTPHVGALNARLEGSKIRRDFRFQVQAHDSVSTWQEVRVLAPPRLLPSSPRIRLTAPAYTGLPSLELPAGKSDVKAVVGSQVGLHAVTDRPLTRAWIGYHRDDHQQSTCLAVALGPLGARTLAEGLTLNAGSQSVLDRLPVVVSADGTDLNTLFRPWLSGIYDLHLEDSLGLGITYLLQVTLTPDPAPTAALEVRAARHGTVVALPDADITVQVLAEDQREALRFGVRSVFLEYRTQEGVAPRILPLHEDRAMRTALAQLLAALASRPLPVPVAGTRVSPQQVAIVRRLSLRQFQRSGSGGDLREGDVLTVQACADDFDDVAVGKEPGRSSEVLHIRIVGRETLEAAVNQDQMQVYQQLREQHEKQRDALQRVREIEIRARRLGKLGPQDLDQLFKALQLQQEIREQLEARQPARLELLRPEVERILETLRDNHMASTPAHERMEVLARQLDGLARQELKRIEMLLNDARTRAETSGGQESNSLTEARRQQERAENTLNELLALLEPWSNSREIKGEARTILQEQRGLKNQTDVLIKNDLLSRKPEDLTLVQRAELDKAREGQQKLGERLSRLLEKMKRVSQERVAKDPDTARELQQAAEQAEKANIAGRMKDAADQLGRNELSNAGNSQRGSIDQLEKLVKTLEGHQDADLDRLGKKLRAAEQKLDDLARDQEELRKKISAAGQITDPRQRAEELKRLARAQRDLQKKQQEAQDMLQQLSRLRGERAGQALTRADAQMDRLGRQLERGQVPDQEDGEKLDRLLEEARRELQRAREEVEEELVREQLAKLADVIKLLKERQAGMISEADRILGDLKQRNKDEWRGLLISLGRLADAQKGLGQETANLVEEQLAGAIVLARIMHKSARAMEQAGNRMSEVVSEYQRRALEPGPDDKNAPTDVPAAAEVVKAQKEVLRRLDQLLDALKPETGVSQRQPQAEEGQGGGGQSRPSDGVPPLAQLKLLRALQTEVNERTEEFTRQHPDIDKLNARERSELQAIRSDQQDVADLLELLLNAGAEGGRP